LLCSLRYSVYKRVHTIEAFCVTSHQLWNSVPRKETRLGRVHNSILSCTCILLPGFKSNMICTAKKPVRYDVEEEGWQEHCSKTTDCQLHCNALYSWHRTLESKELCCRSTYASIPQLNLAHCTVQASAVGALQQHEKWYLLYLGAGSGLNKFPTRPCAAR
jgi:hypothetical protein